MRYRQNFFKKWIFPLFLLISGCSHHSLDQKIGSMLIMGFEGQSLEDPNVSIVLDHLQSQRLGGVILFDYNIKNPQQLKTLNQRLKEANPRAFITIDQEGGKVQRLSPLKGFQTYPSAKEVAEIYSPSEALELYSYMAQELVDYQINLNLAPVVDIDHTDKLSPIIGKLGRSYSSDPLIVVEYVRAFILAHRLYDIHTAIKHFPGHGLAQGDTHNDLIDITSSFQQEELIPFYQLIRDHLVDMVMTAHVMHRDLDPTYPATLSPIILKTLLRDPLHYKGIIISDDLCMGAIQKNFGLEQALIAAIKAGCDLLIYSNNPSAAKGVQGFKPDPNFPLKAIPLIKNAILRGEICEEQINKSYERIQSLITISIVK